MGKLKTYSNTSNLDFSNFQRFVSNYLDNITQIINGDLDIQQNIRSSPLLTLIFPNNTDVLEIPHNLGFIPKGIWTVKLNAAAILYAPTGNQYQWTSSFIYLQSSAAVTASIYII